MNWSKVKDINGTPVGIGTRVRLLKIAEFLRRDLPKEEVDQLESMIGGIFEVTEIDEYGSPWISSSWPQGEGQCHGHSLALDSDEMVVVSQPEG